MSYTNEWVFTTVDKCAPAWHHRYSHWTPTQAKVEPRMHPNKMTPQEWAAAWCLKFGLDGGDFRMHEYEDFAKMVKKDIGFVAYDQLYLNILRDMRGDQWPSTAERIRARAPPAKRVTPKRKSHKRRLR